jgi:DNA-binding response OmpR family regulator
MKVLLVEDDAAIREGMTELMSELAEVHPAPSVEAALRLLDRHLFDLMVTDLRIGGDRKGGRRMVAAARNHLTPVAIISASTEEEIRRSMGELQPDEILMKPFQLDDLLQLGERYLSRRRAVDLQVGDGALACGPLEPVVDGLAASPWTVTEGFELRRIEVAQGASLELSAERPELWVVVGGELSTTGGARGPGSSLHLPQGQAVRLGSAAGARALALRATG